MFALNVHRYILINCCSELQTKAYDLNNPEMKMQENSTKITQEIMNVTMIFRGL